MRRSSAPHRLSLLLACCSVAALAAGCGPRGENGHGPASERSGSQGAFHYTLRSQVEPARVTVGDRAVWRLTAQLSNGAAPDTMLREPTDSTLEIKTLDAPRAVQKESGTAWSASFETRGFDIGRLALPRVLLATVHKGTRDTLEFPPDTLFVDSLTPAMTGSVEADRKALPTELRAIDWVVAIVGGALILGLLAAAIRMIWKARHRARVEEQTAVAPEPPETVFLRALEVLRGEMATLPRDRFYDRLSLAVRSYTAAVTGVPALDRTTWELSRELAERGELDRESIVAVEQMLRRSDLAKFARQEDPLAEAAAALDQAGALSGHLQRESPSTPPSATPPAPGAPPPPGAPPAPSGTGA
ncbi:MAG: hypothetical protein ACRENN_02615 [Candidatus Eiseniibacteriota bacterium]